MMFTFVIQVQCQGMRFRAHASEPEKISKGSSIVMDEVDSISAADS